MTEIGNLNEQISQTRLDLNIETQRTEELLIELKKFTDQQPIKESIEPKPWYVDPSLIPEGAVQQPIMPEQKKGLGAGLIILGGLGILVAMGLKK